MIVIPMAGLSKRFSDAGYSKPKYMLPLTDGTVFDHAVRSFQAYFTSMPFLFIVRDVSGAAAFVERSCRELGIREAKVVVLTAPTAGQAETVEIGLIEAGVGDGEAITIFNIDTFRKGFTFPPPGWRTRSDGFLEVFKGAGPNWSYVRPSPVEDGLVAQTTEKVPISDLCCTGLYHFAESGGFREALARERRRPAAAELFVAPLYNHMIEAGRRIHYRLIDDWQVVFCGVPAEYETLAGMAEPSGSRV